MEMQFFPRGGRWQLRQVSWAFLIPGWISVTIIVVGNCFVPGLAGTVSIRVMINSTAELPCNHNIGHIESLANFRVYWQRNKTMVLTLNDGKIEPEHQNETYADRTNLYNNCSLFLSAIRVSDEGIYDCHVQQREYKKDYKALPHLSVILTVIGPFSQPIILKERATKEATANLTCLSYGGYPKPTIIWYNITGDVALHNNLNTTSFTQDPETLVYNLSSLLVMEISTAFDVACSVRSTYLPEKNSSIIRLEIPPQTPDLKDIIPIAVGIVTSAMIIVATFLVVKNCSPCSKEKKMKNTYSPPQEQRMDVNHEKSDVEARL